MTILYISCPYKGGLFRINTHSDIVEALSDDDRPGTGLAFWQQDFLAQIVGGNTVWLIDKQDGEVHKRISLTQPNYHYHDLKFLGSIALVVNTDLSRIDTYDSRKDWAPREHVGPLTRQPSKGINTCHFNSIAINPTDDTIFGTAFGLTSKHEGWRSNKQGGVLFRISSSGYPVVLRSGLEQPHSITAIGDSVWYCNSISGTMEILRRTGSRWQIVDKFYAGAGFSRGLAFDNQHYYVGLSVNRHPRVYGYSQHYTIETARVAQLSLSGEIVRYWDLPCPEVYEILVDRYVTSQD